MNGTWDKGTRLQAAKEILSNAIDSLQGTPNLEVALRVYGHQSPITATYQDCNDTKLEIPFGKDNYTKIKYRIRSIEAKGTTPIARSLEAAAEDFPDQNSRNIIILITDGLEACDNDPCVIAKKLKDKGVKVTPFVIGLGMDLSYLEKFNCIGTYADAESKEAFKLVLNKIITKNILNTTVQINLNDINKNPKETDVTMHLYEAGTKKLKYTLTHTINQYGNPDTLIIDPAFKYDLVVFTLPKVEKKNIEIKRNIHNTIEVDAPQGYIRFQLANPTKTYLMEMRVMQEKQSSTLNVQSLKSKDKYIVGKYQVEILSLPRIVQEVEVFQNSISTVEIPSPGTFTYSAFNLITGQIFVLNDSGTYEWVCNLDDSSKSGYFNLQPGNYQLVYRQKKLKSTTYTVKKDFRIISNKTTTLNL